MNKLRLAVIGAGNIAQKHLEVLSAFDDVSLVGICNRGNPLIHELASRFSIPAVFDDQNKILNDARPDADPLGQSGRAGITHQSAFGDHERAVAVHGRAA